MKQGGKDLIARRTSLLPRPRPLLPPKTARRPVEPLRLPPRLDIFCFLSFLGGKFKEESQKNELQKKGRCGCCVDQCWCSPEDVFLSVCGFKVVSFQIKFFNGKRKKENLTRNEDRMGSLDFVSAINFNLFKEFMHKYFRKQLSID
jgi:hypothetical protein